MFLFCIILIWVHLAISLAPKTILPIPLPRKKVNKAPSPRVKRTLKPSKKLPKQESNQNEFDKKELSSVKGYESVFCNQKQNLVDVVQSFALEKQNQTKSEVSVSSSSQDYLKDKKEVQIDLTQVKVEDQVTNLGQSQNQEPIAFKKKSLKSIWEEQAQFVTVKRPSYDTKGLKTRGVIVTERGVMRKEIILDPSLREERYKQLLYLKEYPHPFFCYVSEVEEIEKKIYVQCSRVSGLSLESIRISGAKKDRYINEERMAQAGFYLMEDEIVERKFCLEKEDESVNFQNLIQSTGQLVKEWEKQPVVKEGYFEEYSKRMEKKIESLRRKEKELNQVGEQLLKKKDEKHKKPLFVFKNMTEHEQFRYEQKYGRGNEEVLLQEDKLESEEVGEQESRSENEEEVKQESQLEIEEEEEEKKTKLKQLEDIEKGSELKEDETHYKKAAVCLLLALEHLAHIGYVYQKLYTRNLIIKQNGESVLLGLSDVTHEDIEDEDEVLSSGERILWLLRKLLPPSIYHLAYDEFHANKIALLPMKRTTLPILRSVLQSILIKQELKEDFQKVKEMLPLAQLNRLKTFASSRPQLPNRSNLTFRKTKDQGKGKYVEDPQYEEMLFQVSGYMDEEKVREEEVLWSKMIRMRISRRKDKAGKKVAISA